MDDHMSEGEAPGKKPLTRTVTEKSNDKSENGKSEISSILYKDSGYGSLGHSASSSMGPIIPPTGIFNHYFPSSTSERAKTPSTTPSCRSGGSSLVNSQSSSTMTATSKQIDPPGQRIKINASSRKKVKNNLEKEKKKDKETDEQPNFLTSKESKAAKVATLSQALIAVDQFRKSQASKNEKSDKEKEDEIKTLVSSLTEVCQGSKVTSSKREEASQGLYGHGDPVTDTIIESGLNLESDGFCVAVSMSNGMVIHATPTLSSVLGYPKDMWIGRSIIDFVNPKDREFFISQVTDNINLPVEKSKSANIKNKSRSFYCRFRMYSGLKSGFAVKERKKKFRFFKICVCFSEINNIDSEEIYLFITAIPLSSPYNTSNEDGPIKCKNNVQGVFSTKHTSLCTFSFIDENLVSYLGHFPHELEGMDIFEIIHPQDLSIIKESFENLVFGKNCRSQPYRMKTRNGDYVSLVTTWSCFINPWNQQLEFIKGNHTIIKGPKNPQIFMEPAEDQTDVVSEEKGKISSLQEDIKLILQKTVQKNQISKFHGGSSTESKKKLSSFMGTLLQEVAKAENFDLSRTAKHGAVVIGNISPHQSDSSESPPSYNQLTYNENLTRFFNSQPKTLSEKDIVSGFVCSPESYEDNPKDIVKQKFKKEQRNSKSRGSGEDGGRSQGGSGQGSGEQQGSGTGVSGSGEDAKNSSSLQIGLSAGHTQPGGEECFMSQDGCTSGSGSRLGSGSRERDEEYKPTAITEELLEVHNREMEKQMISKFKEAKRVGEPGFLKEGKRVQESASKRVLVSKAKVKIEEAQGASVRKHNSTTPDKMTKSAGRSNACHTESIGQAQEYQRPLAFTDSHFSSYSGTSTPNILRDQSRQGMDGALSYPVPVGSFLQGSLTEEGNQKYIQVPAIMIPISCASSRQSPGFPTNMPLGLMMQGTPTGFFPFCVGDPVRGFSYKMPSQENESDSSLRIKPSTSRQTTAANQFELPNCLAVNSCMTLRENLKGQEVKKSLKKETNLRTTSGDGGSRHTSVKGEPGSALESNASAGVSVKERQDRRNVEQKQLSKQIGDELCSSSQSLYSFLPSSDENDITDFLQASSGRPEDSGEDEKSVRRVARPVLSEPFWNEGITITDKLMKTYQLPQLELDQVLRNDLLKLQKMTQPDIIEDQLKELKMSIDNSEEFDTSKLFMENEEDDDDETETTSPDEGEKDEKYKKRIKNLKKLEKLNIFMEENSPFPEKITPPKNVESDPAKISMEPTEEDVQENPSNLEEAFKLTLRRQDGAKKNEEFLHFQSSRPQLNKFKYGTGLEFNKVTESKKIEEEKEKERSKSTNTNTNVAKASIDPRIKESSDESSDEGLKTSSSVKSSDPNSDDQLKRKKGQVSPSSDSSVKPDDKKLRLNSESDSSSEMKYVRR